MKHIKWVCLTAVVFFLTGVLLYVSVGDDAVRIGTGYLWETGAGGARLYPAAWSNEVVMVPDEKTAVTVAETVFDMVQSGSWQYWSYVPKAVFYDSEEAVWTVKFWPWWKWNDPVHGDWCIALKQSDGEVLAIWVTE